MERYVGILLNSSAYKGIAKGKAGHEAIHLYDEAGSQYGVVPCYFRLRDLRRPGQTTLRAYVRSNRGYVRKKVPTPVVIHNRALYPKSTKARLRLEAWRKAGICVFNSWNRYGKLHIQQLLMEDPQIRPHLPATVPATMQALQEMMSVYDSLIIKPNSSSIGRGIMKLERTERGWSLNYPLSRSGKARAAVFFESELPSRLLRKLKPNYMIQQRLPLATHQGRPFDMRVSVQRDHTGNWQVTGLNAKVAGKHAFLTNVAQGATVYPFQTLMEQFPDLDAGKVYEGIVDFSLRVARHLGNRLPHLADIGLDVGMTEHGFPMFIECNGRDLRYSFKAGGLEEEWKLTYANPIGYASYLLRHKGAEQRSFKTVPSPSREHQSPDYKTGKREASTIAAPAEAAQ